MNFLSFSTPRTPKGYKQITEPTSPLARFNQKLPTELPSLRIWKETCKVFSESTGTDTSTSDASMTLKSPSFSTTTEFDASKDSYKSFDHLILLEDLGADSDEDLNNSFNVFAAKRPELAKRRSGLKEYSKEIPDQAIGNSKLG